jgi:hypothetical protein
MKQLSIILVLLFFTTSCIPLRIAPNIKDYKIKVAKKFKRKLPKNYAFIFEDPKEADEFYNFINIKYDLNYENVEHNVPFSIDSNKYFLSFYESEISTKYLNFIPFIIDACIVMMLDGVDSSSGEIEIVRTGHWYIVMTVFDSNMVDCLEPNYINRTEVINYMENLKMEYLFRTNTQY